MLFNIGFEDTKYRWSFVSFVTSISSPKTFSIDGKLNLANGNEHFEMKNDRRTKTAFISLGCECFY